MGEYLSRGLANFFSVTICYLLVYMSGGHRVCAIGGQCSVRVWWTLLGVSLCLLGVRESWTKLLEVENTQNYGPRARSRAEHLTGVSIDLCVFTQRKETIDFVYYPQMGGGFREKKFYFLFFCYCLSKIPTKSIFNSKTR